ncbi:MAG: DNA polymerase III, subunit gamma and tau [Gammaproteobacteria bacterium GWE2_37_16]|nr:MAG: DNA polymerase III, subunit gamma and tau [Gammaproteobacteria bacterium GWE2_37_16]
MSYHVLARKYRPKSFSEVVGQEHVLQTLSNALTQNRLHHAYLFTGTRGVGKTTLGRILAKCLNCETGVTAIPCGKCNACISIDAGKFIDLIEIDAASRTKVEDMRDILQNVQYAPNNGRYKIYLIDEVHMLSGHSFNALLKTLEEPPEHVKFFLATTDKQKLPITILSRCLQFNLKNVPVEKIQAQLKNILTQENIPYEDSALLHLAIAAQGSVRDALSLLDQAIAHGANTVKNAAVNSMLGTIEQDQLFKLCEALAQKNTSAIFVIINELSQLAVDFTYVLDELLTLLHRIALLQTVPNCTIASWENLDILKNLTQQFSKEDLQLYYQIGLMGKRDLYLAPSQKIGFEMVMLRMLAFKPESLNNPLIPAERSPVPAVVKPNASQPICNIVAPISSKEKPITIPPIKAEQPDLSFYDELLPHSTPKPKEHVLTTKSSPSTQQNYQTTKPQEIKFETKEEKPLNLHDILPALGVTGPTQALLKHCVINKYDQETIDLLLEPNQAAFLNSKHVERLNQAFSNYLQRPIRVNIEVGKPNLETMANITSRNNEQKQTAAQNSLAEDPYLQKIATAFNGKIIQETTSAI